MPRLLVERDAAGEEGGVVAGEIVGLEEEADAAAGLVADPGHLRGALGLGEQQPRAALGRDHDPALATAEIGIGEKREAETFGVPGDRPVIVVDDKRDGGDARSGHGVLQEAATAKIAGAGSPPQ